MKRSELSECEFEEEGFKIKIKRGNGAQPIITTTPFSAHPFPLAAAPVEAAAPTKTSASPASSSSPSGADEAGFTYVKSPMVGTFYRSPSPETPSFVEANARVDEKTVVCIIEAMKIMNEIH